MKSTTEAATTSNLLDNFSLDDDVEFFGIKSEGGKKKNNIDITEVNNDNIVTDEGKAKTKTTSIKEVKTDDDDIGDNEEEVVFFDQKSTTKTPIKKKTESKEVEEEEETEEETKPVKKSVKKEDNGNDTIVEEEEDTRDKSPKSKKDKTKDNEEDANDDKFFSTLAGELKERGVFQNIEIPEDKVLTEEEFFELHEKEVDARVDETIESIIQDLDEDGKRFLKFKKDGGKTHEFFSVYSNTLDLEKLDESDSNQVDKVLRYYISAVEGLEDEELEDRMKYIKDGGKAKTYATKWFEKIKDEEEREKAALDKAVLTAREKREKSAKEFNDALAEVASKTETVGVFNISKADQKRLVGLITKPTVKIGKNKFIPEFSNKLGKVLKAESEKDKQNLLLLAKLLDNDFNVKDIVSTKVKTEVTREAKSKLRDAKNSVSPHSARRSEKKELADFFDGDEVT